MPQIMDCTEADNGIEYELTEFLLMATQDELNAANAIQAQLDNQKRFMTMFDDSRASSPDVNTDEDVAEDIIDVALSASSFVASWINKPVNGCQSGEYGRVVTPNENDKDELEHAKIEQQLQGIEGVVSWRDAMTDQILVGLDLRQGGQTEETSGAAIIGLNTPFTDSSKSTSDATGEVDKSDNVQGEPEPAAPDACIKENAAEAKTEAKGEENTSAVDARDESHPRRASIDGSERSVGSRNDVVIELVQKCLQTNGQPKITHPVPSQPAQRGQTKDALTENAQAPAQSMDARVDSSVHRDILAAVDRNAGSKSDLIKKLAAKCLAMNKQSNNNLQQMKKPLKPASYLISSPRQMGPPRPETPLYMVMQDADNYSSAVDTTGQANSEIRDPPIGPDVCRDPPELKQSTFEMQQIIRPRVMHVKWSTDSTTMAVKKPLYIETQSPRQEGNSLTLNIESAGRTPAHYAQPPRPETPFHAGGDTSRCMKMFTRRSPSSFHQVSADQRVDQPKSTPSKESVLSSSATLRRRHYKEMLMRERAAKNAAVE
ncbi:hypothetical protein ACHAWO_001615 [Cyclotella atomus]|uniref:Uncharacterized protein n=1 Tax=Cyclotella atomus TaxID=382360 RepID=A0ABD3P1E1_9STRA